MITEFRGEYRWLSNFYKLQYPIMVYINGGEYLFHTTENLYQGMKCKHDDDMIRCSVLTAGESKAFGKIVELCEDWDEIRLDAMYEINRMKYDQPFFKEKLLSTGEQVIVEGNTWHDNFFGNCSCEKCNDIIGFNHLGILIMKIRDEIKGIN